MPGEILVTTASERSAAAVAEIVVPVHERGHGGVALLLTVAAIVAAVISFRAAIISSSASDSWQSALRSEVKRSAAAMEDVRSLYQSELPIAVRILQARIVQAEMLAEAQGQSGPARQALLQEADVQGQIITALSSSSELATAPQYSLPARAELRLAQGRVDEALADLRATYPDLLALNPDGLETTGDRLAHEAELTILALVPTSVAAFLGVLAQPFRRRRMMLLRLGALALAGGMAMFVVVQVVS